MSCPLKLQSYMQMHNAHALCHTLSTNHQKGFTEGNEEDIGITGCENGGYFCIFEKYIKYAYLGIVFIMLICVSVPCKTHIFKVTLEFYGAVRDIMLHW